MKVSITGHTAGIGKALFDYFVSNQHEVLGFSRSNGFDIKNVDDRKRILESSIDCDMFINNAYDFTSHVNYQLIIFNQFVAQWKNSSKTILNISSTAGDYPDRDQHYNNNKNQLDEMNRKFNKSHPKLHVVNIKPGCTDTQLMNEVEGQKLSTETIVETVDLILRLKDRAKITSLTIFPNY